MEMSALQAIREEVSLLPWLLVTHQRPDTDAWICLWAAHKFVVPSDAPRRIEFIAAGSRIDDADRLGHNVLEMDVGGDDCDQHGRQLARGSSFELLVEKYNLLDKHPALAPFVEFARATDNVEEMPFHSVHFLFKGFPAMIRNGEEIDWGGIAEAVFEILDVLYGQEENRLAAREEFREKGRITRLSNGAKIGTVWWNPHLREPAYEAGAHVVMWTVGKGKKGFEVGIQVHRNATLSLQGVMRAIRLAEAKKRDMTISSEVAGALGGNGDNPVPGWFLHDSKKLIVCGSRARHLQGDEFTRLSPGEILEILKKEIGSVKPSNPRR